MVCWFKRGFVRSDCFRRVFGQLSAAPTGLVCWYLVRLFSAIVLLDGSCLVILEGFWVLVFIDGLKGALDREDDFRGFLRICQLLGLFFFVVVVVSFFLVLDICKVL